MFYTFTCNLHKYMHKTSVVLYYTDFMNQTCGTKKSLESKDLTLVVYKFY